MEGLLGYIYSRVSRIDVGIRIDGNSFVVGISDYLRLSGEIGFDRVDSILRSYSGCDIMYIERYDYVADAFYRVKYVWGGAGYCRVHTI